ncbi:MAG: YihY/virulence factor BrkB family protein [Oscillospiraceae bacterium]|nr:YihY/virulence factor BrkB family protein [Oscillospiraceae bacterium]
MQPYLRRINSYHVSLYAANAGFYIVLSVFPALMLVVSILPYTKFSSEDFLTAVSGAIPNFLHPLLGYVVDEMEQTHGGTVISLSAIVAIWSSSRGVYCIQRGLNAISGVRESRSYLHMRLVCMAYMVFLIFALLLTLAFHVFGQYITAYLASKNVPILQFLAKILQFRGVLTLIILVALFTAILSVFPNRKIPLRRAFPGALAAAIGWLLFSSLFSVYVGVFGSYSVYGSLSVVLLCMLWLYSCICILFYGGVLNQLLERRKK